LVGWFIGWLVHWLVGTSRTSPSDDAPVAADARDDSRENAGLMAASAAAPRLSTCVWRDAGVGAGAITAPRMVLCRVSLAWLGVAGGLDALALSHGSCLSQILPVASGTALWMGEPGRKPGGGMRARCESCAPPSSMKEEDAEVPASPPASRPAPWRLIPPGLPSGADGSRAEKWKDDRGRGSVARVEGTVDEWTLLGRKSEGRARSHAWLACTWSEVTGLGFRGRGSVYRVRGRGGGG
jgi:hypothetical protein